MRDALAKVEGLARLLAWVGKERQVVEFTHDDRLPDAIRRLQLPAVIWDVTRREGSVVELTKNEDPVSRNVDDARALARTTELPRGCSRRCGGRLLPRRAGGRVPRGYSGTAAQGRGTALRGRAGAHRRSEAPRAARPDAARRRRSRRRRRAGALRQRYRQAVVKAFNAARQGTHERYQGGLRHFVEDTAQLANALRP
jgi:hypothetical protein